MGFGRRQKAVWSVLSQADKWDTWTDSVSLARAVYGVPDEAVPSRSQLVSVGSAARV